MTHVRCMPRPSYCSVALATLSSILTTVVSSVFASEKRSVSVSLSTSRTVKPETSSLKLDSTLTEDETYNVEVVVLDGTGQMCLSANQSMDNFSYCMNHTDNSTDTFSPLPKHLYFTDDNVVSVAAYSCLFIVAACGNLTVFITLFRNRRTKSRINMFIMHLAIADLIVTFIMLPLEIAWNSTVAWLAGDIACRLLTFFRAIGFYLSSFILVSISLDRYFAIMRPLSISDADNRARMMLTVSWLMSITASVPQSVIFHVEQHPKYKWFTQCVTFNFFPSQDHELAYNLFSIIALYGLPLTIITSSYCVIMCHISQKSRQSKYEISGKVYDRSGNEQAVLRRSGVGNIERAKARTLKMTLVIVGAYVLCWTPYFVISAWFYFDSRSAQKIDSKVQRGLFIFAVSNSCINPLVYGMFTIKFKRELIRCCYCLRGRLKRPQWEDSTGIRRSLLLPLNRNSESCSSSKNIERLSGKSAKHNTSFTSHALSSRYSFAPPQADAVTSSSRVSLTSLGKEDHGSSFNSGQRR